MTDSKSVVLQGTVGSNPTPSASKNKGLAIISLTPCFLFIQCATPGATFEFLFPCVCKAVGVVLDGEYNKSSEGLFKLTYLA